MLKTLIFNNTSKILKISTCNYSKSFYQAKEKIFDDEVAKNIVKSDVYKRLKDSKEEEDIKTVEEEIGDLHVKTQQEFVSKRPSSSSVNSIPRGYKGVGR